MAAAVAAHGTQKHERHRRDHAVGWRRRGGSRATLTLTRTATEAVDLDRGGVREIGQQRHVVLAELRCGPRSDLVGDVDLLAACQGHEFAVGVAPDQQYAFAEGEKAV